MINDEHKPCCALITPPLPPHTLVPTSQSYNTTDKENIFFSDWWKKNCYLGVSISREIIPLLRFREVC